MGERGGGNERLCVMDPAYGWNDFRHRGHFFLGRLDQKASVLYTELQVLICFQVKNKNLAGRVMHSLPPHIPICKMSC